MVSIAEEEVLGRVIDVAVTGYPSAEQPLTAVCRALEGVSDVSEN